MLVSSSEQENAFQLPLQGRELGASQLHAHTVSRLV